MLFVPRLYPKFDKYGRPAVVVSVCRELVGRAGDRDLARIRRGLRGEHAIAVQGNHSLSYERQRRLRLDYQGDGRRERGRPSFDGAASRAGRRRSDVHGGHPTRRVCGTTPTFDPRDLGRQEKPYGVSLFKMLTVTD